MLVFAGVEQVYGFVDARNQLRSMVFDHAAGFFKARDFGRGWRCAHAEMIDPAVKQAAENSLRTQNAPTGAKARVDLWALRGAEAPLFHGGACIFELFPQPAKLVQFGGACAARSISPRAGR